MKYLPNSKPDFPQIFRNSLPNSKLDVPQIFMSNLQKPQIFPGAQQKEPAWGAVCGQPGVGEEKKRGGVFNQI